MKRFALAFLALSAGAALSLVGALAILYGVGFALDRVF